MEWEDAGSSGAWDPASAYIEARSWLLREWLLRDMGGWLWPMFGSSLSFAFADVLCDVVIMEKGPDGEEEEEEEGEGEDEEDEEDGTPLEDASAGKPGESERSPMLPGANNREMGGADRNSSGVSRSATSPRAKALQLTHEQQGLTGEQDTAMAGMRMSPPASGSQMACGSPAWPLRPRHCTPHALLCPSRATPCGGLAQAS